tara:strand:+ start:273 stop:446 length:174 start_codon:yes stop_codon:yes gene_type:complete
VFASQETLTFSESYHQSLVGESIDEPWYSFRTIKKQINGFSSKQVRATVSRFADSII